MHVHLLLLLPALSSCIATSFVYGQHAIPVTKHTRVPRLFQPLVKSVGALGTRRLTVYKNRKYQYDVDVEIRRNGRILPMCASSITGKLPVSRALYCSGFLVSPSLFVTAAHCFSDNSAFKLAKRNTIVLMDFESGINPKLEKKSTTMQPFMESPLSSVYFIKNSQTRKYNDGSKYSDIPTKERPWIDYAILELDRDVINSPDFNFVGVQKPDSYFPIKKGTELVNAAHSNGLPLLLDMDGVVSQNFGTKNFACQMDQLSGSSGSPIVDKKTGLVVGILINGVLSEFEPSEEEIDGKTRICYIRARTRNADEKDAVIASSTVQWYDYIDPNPVFFKTIRRGSKHTKALQQAINYIKIDGIWDSAFSEYIKDKASKLLTADGHKVFSPNSFDGTFVDGTFLSMILPELKKGDCNQKSFKCAAVAALKTLLKVEALSSEFNEELEPLVESFQKKMGYKEDGVVTRALWRHLFNQ